MTTWRVHCGEFFHDMDPDDEWTVEGFATLEAAQDYARRFIRAEIESARKPDDTPAQTFDLWIGFGDYAGTKDFDPMAWARWSAENPATDPMDTDYKALEPTIRPAIKG